MALTIIPWFIFYEWSSLFEMLVVLVYVWDIWDIAHHLFFISIILQDLNLFKFKGPVVFPKRILLLSCKYEWRCCFIIK